MRRVAALGMLVVGLLTACGDDPFANVGDISRDFVYGDTSTTTTILVEDAGEQVPIEIVSVTELAWWNDGIENQAFGDPGYVAAQVWGRGDGLSRFIQASRAELAAALPGVQFPELVPEDVGWITSQLVYDTASATLDAETSAAFGFWEVEPYSVSEGRMAVLRVGVASADAGTGRSEVITDPVQDGLSLTWTDDGYRYELFCRATLREQLCLQMVDSMAPLRLMLPPGTETADTEA